MKCRHEKAEALHSSEHFTVVTCLCGKQWTGNPNPFSNVNRTPKWVVYANNRGVRKIKRKRKK